MSATCRQNAPGLNFDDALDLVREADLFRAEFNTVRPHEALTWNRPLDVHQGLADPATPTFHRAEILPTS